MLSFIFNEREDRQGGERVISIFCISFNELVAGDILKEHNWKYFKLEAPTTVT